MEMAHLFRHSPNSADVRLRLFLLILLLFQYIQLNRYYFQTKNCAVAKQISCLAEEIRKENLFLHVRRMFLAKWYWSNTRSITPLEVKPEWIIKLQMFWRVLCFLCLSMRERTENKQLVIEKGRKKQRMQGGRGSKIQSSAWGGRLRSCATHNALPLPVISQLNSNLQKRICSIWIIHHQFLSAPVLTSFLPLSLTFRVEKKKNVFMWPKII